MKRPFGRQESPVRCHAGTHGQIRKGTFSHLFDHGHVPSQFPFHKKRFTILTMKKNIKGIFRTNVWQYLDWKGFLHHNCPMANAPIMLRATQTKVFLRRQADCSKVGSTWGCTEDESSGEKRKKSTLANRIFQIAAFMFHLPLPYRAKRHRSSCFLWFHGIGTCRILSDPIKENRHRK